MGAEREQLAERLRSLRGELGMSLKELERRTHISDSSLSRYLSGKSLPPWPVVAAMQELAARDPGELRPLWERAQKPIHQPDETIGPPAAEPADDTAPAEHMPATEPRARGVLRVAMIFLLGAGTGLAAPPGLGYAEHEYHTLTEHRPPPNPLIHQNKASGPAGRFDYTTDPYVRTKSQPGPFRMTLHDSPTGWLCVKLVNSATRAVIGRPECLNNNDTKTLVPYVPAVTRFQVAAMSGGAGQYHGSMYY